MKLCVFVGAPFFILHLKLYVHIDSGVCRRSLLHGVFEGHMYVFTRTYKNVCICKRSLLHIVFEVTRTYTFLYVCRRSLLHGVFEGHIYVVYVHIKLSVCV